MGWPVHINKAEVWAWMVDLIPRLEAFAGGDDNLILPYRRKLWAFHKTPLRGVTNYRIMDIAFVNGDITHKHDTSHSWSNVLVAGELKSKAQTDITSYAWVDLAHYAREVLSHQDNRRFVMGFTLCGSFLRVWMFDRLEGTGSETFNINTEEGGQQFVRIMLGFILMDEERLGLYPNVLRTPSGQKYTEIERNGQMECLIVDKVIKRTRCVAGRATTCWLAYHKDDPEIKFVIKDSWQDTTWGDEGKMLKEATEKEVINVARYYHHETVRVRGAEDDVRNSIRQGLDVTKAKNYPTQHDKDALPNRIHRRVVRGDVGKPIYNSSSPVALLAAFERFIDGHEALYNAGILYGDISINNLMISEDDENQSWLAF